MAFVRILNKLLRDKKIGKLIVPIIPDEARTFGMDSLFPQVGIYSHVGQVYEPVDIILEALEAQRILAEKYDVAANVWSVTSYKELHRDCLTVERWNRLHPGQEAKVPYVTQCLQDEPGVLIAASDYVRALPYSIADWLPRTMIGLGTDGYGRSDCRAA